MLKITNPNQFEKLVEEMGKNPSFAKGFRRGSVPSNYKEQWEKISTALNALGPPRRTGDGWQKVWRDLKFKTKRKLVAQKADIKETKRLKWKLLTLSPLEESVANILHFHDEIQVERADQEVKGQDSNADFEIVKIEEISDFDLDWTDVRNASESESQELPSASNSLQNANRTPLKRNTIPNKTIANSKHLKRKKISKLKKNSNHYELILPSVKRSLHDMNEYRKELLEIEAKKLKLAEEKNEREKEMHEAVLKIRKIELAIKEKELQLYNQYLN